MRKSLTIFIILLFTSFTYATTYYVSELFGDDDNNGTDPNTPFATIQKAADVMVAGDSVLVDFGQYSESVVPKNNGTSSDPIVYRAMEQGEAEITYGDTTMIPTFALHSGSIYVMDDVFRTVDRVSEDGAPLIRKTVYDSLNTAGTFFHDRSANQLYVWSSDSADPATHQDTVFFMKASFDIVEGSYLTIDGFKIKGFRGIYAIVGENLSPMPGLIIQNNIFEGSGLATKDISSTFDQAIVLDGGAANAANTYESLVIKQNEFTDWYRAIFLQNCGRKGLISANSFVQIGIPANPIDLWENDPTIRIEGDDDYPDEAQTQGLLIETNYFKVWGRCFYIRRGRIDSIKIENNIADFGGSLFMINYNGTNVHVINNTIVGCRAEYACRYNFDARDGRIYNNIFAFNDTRSLFFDNSNDTVNAAGAQWDYNYWIVDSLAAGTRRDDQLVRARIPGESGGPGGPNAIYGHPMVAGLDTVISIQTGDTLYLTEIPDMFQPPLPLFVTSMQFDTTLNLSSYTVADFALDQNCLAINAGLADVAPATDFYGNTRDANPDIGAIEYGVTGISDLAELFPKEITLHQNYPNPFNPTTNIKYIIPKSGKISLTVYNLLGQKVITLFDGFQQMGTHVVNWDGLNRQGVMVAGGIYFCQLKTLSHAKTIKMILLK